MLAPILPTPTKPTRAFLTGVDSVVLVVLAVDFAADLAAGLAVVFFATSFFVFFVSDFVVIFTKIEMGKLFFRCIRNTDSSK